MSALKNIIKDLRLNQTDVEKLFWNKVRNRQLEGHKFRRQQQIENYIVDFVCFERGLIVELDGGHHAESIADNERTKFLETKGFLVKRYWNNEVIENMDGVLSDLLETLNTLTPTLSLKGEGGNSGFGGEL